MYRSHKPRALPSFLGSISQLNPTESGYNIVDFHRILLIDVHSLGNEIIELHFAGVFIEVVNMFV